MTYGNAMGLFGLGAEEIKKFEVWRKGHIIAGYDPAVWRSDDYGHVMRYSDHGNRLSEYGWEMDHITPSALGGSDHIYNLRPLHCKRNASLGGLLGGLLDR